MTCHPTPDTETENMAASAGLGLRILLALSLTLGPCQGQSTATPSDTSSDPRCAWLSNETPCNGTGALLDLGANALLFFNSTSGQCAHLSCVDNNTSMDLLFPDMKSCMDACVGHPPVLGGCEGTRYGCCPDGKTPKGKDGSCDEASQEDPPNKGPNMPTLSGNGKIIIGVTTSLVGIGLIVLVVGVVVAWIRHKRRKDEEKRMNDLLKMYENAYEESSSSEDEGTSDDDPVSMRLL